MGAAPLGVLRVGMGLRHRVLLPVVVGKGLMGVFGQGMHFLPQLFHQRHGVRFSALAGVGLLQRRFQFRTQRTNDGFVVFSCFQRQFQPLCVVHHLCFHVRQLRQYSFLSVHGPTQLTVKLFVLEPKPFDGLVERQCGFYLGHVWGGVDCFGGVGGGWLCWSSGRTCL